MYLSLEWVKDYLKLPRKTNQELALSLTMSTVEVENIFKVQDLFKDIVIGKIKEIEKHPQANRLQVCKVDTGRELEQIVCGGVNLYKGMLVAVAQIGAKIKWHGIGDYVELEKVKIRGVESKGMIVSSSEIGLINLFPQELEREILDLSHFKIKPGQLLASALELDDIVIDIDNKSINHRPDLWGQYGLARELAAIYKIKLKEYKVSELNIKKEEKLKVSVKDKDNCYRYLGLIIKNIKVSDSPWWLKKRLFSVGIKSINNIVDVTNYVMYELGQPLHAFDAKQIIDYHIKVKSAQEGEEFVTLDGVKRKLPQDALMIADSNKYLALAGIMGGQNSEINNKTTEIILESANFKAANIRRTSIKLGLRSDSSARFEKSLDPQLADLAIKKAIELILSINPEAYVASKLVDINNNPFKKIVLKVSEELINKIFGVTIPTREIKNILKRLQFKVKYKYNKFIIKIPSFRATKDISIPEDIVEEVARIYGYDNIDSKLPLVKLQKPFSNVFLDREKDIKYYLSLAHKYNEVYTYPFTNISWAKKLNLDLVNNHIKVTNPMSPEQSFLNISLLPNLLLKAEENLRYFKEFKIFELERVFNKQKSGKYKLDNKNKKFLPQQDKHLTGIEVSENDDQESFSSLKGTINALAKYWNINWIIEEANISFAKLAYNIKYQDIVLGSFGLLNKDLCPKKNNISFWDFNFITLIKYIDYNKKYIPIYKYPSIERDLAIIIDKDIQWKKIEEEVYKASSLVIETKAFDIYSGQGVEKNKKSLAFHIKFRNKDRTLLAKEVDKIIDDILKVLDKKFKAKLR